MAVSGVLGKQNLEGFQVSVDPPAEVYDGIETLLRVQLANRRRWLPVCLLRVEVAGGATTFVLAGRGTTQRDTLPATFHGRGLHHLEALRVSSPFPVNFFVRSRPLRLEREVLVCPAPRPCPAVSDSEGRRPQGEQAVSRLGQQGEVARIADYSGSEPLKQIHWKLSARHEGLKVKQFSAAAAEPVLLDPERLPGTGLEDRLGCAAFLVLRFCRENRPVGLRLPRRTIPAASGDAHRLRLLRELALYGQD